MKEYGVCNILGGPNIELLIEYKNSLEYDMDGIYYPKVVGRDLITGTKVESMRFKGYTPFFEEALKKGIVKKNKFIIINQRRITEKDMIERLKNMSKDDILEYVEKVNKTKEFYKEEIEKKEKSETDDLFNIRSVKIEKKRVRRLAKEYLKYIVYNS